MLMTPTQFVHSRWKLPPVGLECLSCTHWTPKLGVGVWGCGGVGVWGCGGVGVWGCGGVGGVGVWGCVSV